LDGNGSALFYFLFLGFLSMMSLYFSNNLM